MKTQWSNNIRLIVQMCAVLVVTLLVGKVQAGGNADPVLSKLMVDQLEFRDGSGQYPLVLEAQAWVGMDVNKLWLKADLERAEGQTHEAEVQVLYSRAVTPYWDFQFGLRKDFQPTPSRSWAVIGLQGLAPYFFEVDSALFIGDSGHTALRLSAEYELLFTQRLVLTPELEINLYGQDDADTGTGSGLSDVAFGLRLRYEVRREFAPYVGVNWSKAFGSSADFARAEGAGVDELQWVVGVRAWF